MIFEKGGRRTERQTVTLMLDYRNLLFIKTFRRYKQYKSQIATRQFGMKAAISGDILYKG